MTQAINASGWPIIRGIQTVKEVSYLNMRQASAAAALSKLWSDTFLTNAGIYAAGSAGYTYRGSANFDVIRTTTGAEILAAATASASGGSNPSYINDGLLNAAAVVPSGANQFVKFDLGAGVAKKLVRLGFYSHDNITFAIDSFILQGSNDDTNWTNIYTEAGLNQSLNTWKYVDFTNATAYRYYRLFNLTASEANNYITEISGYEDALASASVVSVLALDLAADITNLMMFADVTLNTGTAAYYASTDDGSTWTAVTPETLAAVPAGKKIRIKVELTGDAELESWGVAV